MVGVPSWRRSGIISYLGYLLQGQRCVVVRLSWQRLIVVMFAVGACELGLKKIGHNKIIHGECRFLDKERRNFIGSWEGTKRHRTDECKTKGPDQCSKPIHNTHH